MGNVGEVLCNASKHRVAIGFQYEYPVACMVSLLRFTVLALVVTSSCSGHVNPKTVTAAARVTQTFSLTGTILDSNGAMKYGSEPIPTITLSKPGLVEAAVSFHPIAGCQFVFHLDPKDRTGNPVLKSRGPGPDLSLRGDVEAGTYIIGLVAREGMSLCGPLPAAGVPLPHTITVTHP